MTTDFKALIEERGITFDTDGCDGVEGFRATIDALRKVLANKPVDL